MDDDEDDLYGPSKEETNQEIPDQAPEDSSQAAKDDEDDESDDESDDLEIVLDVNKKEETDESRRTNAKPVALTKTATATDNNQNVSATNTTIQKSTVDLDEIGKLDGKDIIDVDLEGFEDRPWRKPGADITDYFNFGFNEITWRNYCNKQKEIRDANRAEQRADLMSFGMGMAGLPMGMPGMPGMPPLGMMGMPGMPFMPPQGMSLGSGQKYQRSQQRTDNSDDNSTVLGKRSRSQDEAVIELGAASSKDQHPHMMPPGMPMGMGFPGPSGMFPMSMFPGMKPRPPSKS